MHTPSSAFSSTTPLPLRVLPAFELIATKDCFQCPRTHAYVNVPLSDIGKPVAAVSYTVYRIA